ncbi:zinc-dependent alcohol dehydrogenase family protein [Occallatibacter riparius]|uniref:NAD(P)-dependent alcohol dehydrogenase n=1 Tax=Occallatibacter riparius TaxID=1002689 RepID=A0A9J7BH99_9BACT|nr:NAD(P)-dependent alcohol dehydrogenase [Occallatibacter riparius]UWZ82103.1 NAD(P)-dependent alcohol dehydrogenase [Occallatibacter riparius]
MHVWQISSFGIDSLEFVERPDPQPGPGQVVVRVHAISFNYRDLMMVKGLYNPKLKLPRVPCSDGAGEVVAVGSGVTQWKPGDRVAGIFMQNWIDGPPSPEKVKGALGGDVDGMLAEYVLLGEDGLVAIPEHLSFQEAATLPCAAVTAWNALCAGDLKPGGTVLIQGTGGVSIFALQFARLKGAKVLGISGNQEKLNRAFDLGLDAGVNYNEVPEWDRWAMEQTGEGVDLIVEVGGLGTLPRSLRALRMGGTIAQVGVLTGVAAPEPLPLPAILHKQARLRGIYVGSRQDFIDMNRAISLTQLRPVGEDFPWSHAREVLARLEEASHFGKLVMTIG